MFVAYAWLVKWMGLEASYRRDGALAALLNAAVPLIGYLRWSNETLSIVSSVTIALLSVAVYTVYPVDGPMCISSSCVAVACSTPRASPREKHLGRRSSTTPVECFGSHDVSSGTLKARDCFVHSRTGSCNVPLEYRMWNDTSPEHDCITNFYSSPSVPFLHLSGPSFLPQ